MKTLDRINLGIRKAEILPAKAPAKPKDNALIFDEVEGEAMGYLSPDEFTNLGRLRRYRGRMVYAVKRFKDGRIEPIVPAETPGEVTPELAGDALEDVDSPEIYKEEANFWEALSDYKLPIIVFIELLIIFILAFTFTDGGVKSLPVPGITQ